MEVFEAVPKQWGNSLGITIPKEIVKKRHLSTKQKISFLMIPRTNVIKETFGTLKSKKSTQKIMDEIDEGYD